MGKQSEQSFKIVDFLRFPLIMVVVLIHCNYPASGLSDVQISAPIFYTIQQFLQYHIYTVAVPLFFFISGYLFYRNGIPNISVLKEKLQKRVHTLLVPYLLWNTVGMILFLLKASPILIKYFPQYSDFTPTISNLLEGYIGLHYSPDLLPYDISLWFIRNLLFVLIFTPVIDLLFKILKEYSIIIPFLFTLFWPDFFYNFYSSLFYFMLGASIPISGIDLSSIIQKYKYYFIIFWIINLILLSSVSRPILCDLLYLSCICLGIFSALYIGYLFILRGIAIYPMLAKSTFFIYAFHALYPSVAIRIGTIIIPPTSEIAAFLSYLLIFILEAGLSFIVFLLLNRLIPKTISIFCGYRS